MLRRGNRMVEEIFEEQDVKKVSVPHGAWDWWVEEVAKVKGKVKAGS